MICRILSAPLLIYILLLTGCGTNNSEIGTKAGEQAGKVQTFVRNNLELQCLAPNETAIIPAVATFGADSIQTEVTEALSSALIEAASNTVKSRLPGGSGGGEGLTQALPIVKAKLTGKLAKATFSCGVYKGPGSALVIGVKEAAPHKDKIGMLKELDPKITFPLTLGQMTRSANGTYSFSKVPASVEPSTSQNTQEKSPTENN